MADELGQDVVETITEEEEARFRGPAGGTTPIYRNESDGERTGQRVEQQDPRARVQVVPTVV